MTSQEFVDRWADSGTSAAVKMKQQIDDMIAAAYERGKANGAKKSVMQSVNRERRSQYWTRRRVKPRHLPSGDDVTDIRAPKGYSQGNQTCSNGNTLDSLC